MKREPINFKLAIILISIAGILGFIFFAILILISVPYNRKVKEDGVKCEVVCINKEKKIGRYYQRSHNRRISYDYTFEVTSPDEYKGTTFTKNFSLYNAYKVGDTTTAYYYNELWHLYMYDK